MGGVGRVKGCIREWGGPGIRSALRVKRDVRGKDDKLLKQPGTAELFGMAKG